MCVVYVVYTLVLINVCGEYCGVCVCVCARVLSIWWKCVCMSRSGTMYVIVCIMCAMWW